MVSKQGQGLYKPNFCIYICLALISFTTILVWEVGHSNTNLNRISKLDPAASSDSASLTIPTINLILQADAEAAIDELLQVAITLQGLDLDEIFSEYQLHSPLSELIIPHHTTDHGIQTSLIPSPFLRAQERPTHFPPQTFLNTSLWYYDSPSQSRPTAIIPITSIRVYYDNRGNIHQIHIRRRQDTRPHFPT